MARRAARGASVCGRPCGGGQYTDWEVANPRDPICCAVAALQPERHEHMPFDRLRITGAHHPDRADRQGRSRPVRRHVSPARRWLGDCLAPAGGGASATTAAGGIPQHRTCPRDPCFAELAERTPTVAQLVHLRWATEGLAVFANTHPFSQDGITLAHNGSISPRPVLD